MRPIYTTIPAQPQSAPPIITTSREGGVSEAEFFAALDRLAHPLAANEVTELAGYRYSIILAVMLVISGERTLLWESAREALVLQYPGQG